MPSKPFLKPVLRGGRFEEHSVPLDLLGDLAAFNDIIFAVARAEYLKDNPTRKRLPSGFRKEETALALQKVEDGSTILSIAFMFATLGGNTTDTERHIGYFERARDVVLTAISTAAEAPQLPPPNPAIAPAIRHFKSFGKGLRDDEAIEFPRTDGLPPVRYTRDVQYKIILAEPGEQGYVDEGELRGLIVDLDQTKKSFRLRLPDGREVTGPTSRSNIEAIESGVTNYRRDVKVMIQGSFVRDRGKKLLRIDRIDQATMLDPLDIPAQLDDIRVLKLGWNEGYGLAFDPAGLDWFEEASEEFFPEKAPYPRIFPDLDGTLQLEWRPGRWRADLCVDLESRQGSFHALNLDTQRELDGEFALDSPKGWAELGERLSIILGA